MQLMRLNRSRAYRQAGAWCLVLGLLLNFVACQMRDQAEQPAEPKEPSSGPSATAEQAPAAPRPARSSALPEEIGGLLDALETDFPSSADALFVEGEILELFEQSEEASWCWKECLALDPRQAYAHEQLGMLAIKHGEFERAVEYFRQACELDPDLPFGRLHLGKALLKLGRNEEAIPVLEDQTTRQARNPEGWFRLGQAHYRKGNFQAAKSSYEKALGQYADYPAAWFGLAQACSRLGETEQARESRERFVQLDRRNAEANRDQRVAVVRHRHQQAFAQASMLAADVYAVKGRSEEARRLWRRASELDPTNIQSRTALAQSLARDNHAEEAIEVLLELQKIQPRDINTLFRLAALHSHLRQLDAAEKCYQRALELAPDHPHALGGLAQLYLATESRYPDAERLAERLVQRYPTADNYFLLSHICRMNRNAGRARESIKEAIRLDPGNLRYVEAASLLERE